MGRRIVKNGPSGSTTYVYDAFGQLAAEYSTVPRDPLCTTCYLSYDLRGDVRMVTDQSGNVVARHDYLPFGVEIPANTASRNSQWGLTTDAEQKFTGQIRDTETGMDFFHARYYGSAFARFTSPDPANAGANRLDPQSWNAYAYVSNNPLTTVDPSGMGTLDPPPTFIGTGTCGLPCEGDDINAIGACIWDQTTNSLYCGGTAHPGCVAEGTEGCIHPSQPPYGSTSGTSAPAQPPATQSSAPPPTQRNPTPTSGPTSSTPSKQNPTSSGQEQEPSLPEQNSSGQQQPEQVIPVGQEYRAQVWLALDSSVNSLKKEAEQNVCPPGGTRQVVLRSTRNSAMVGLIRGGISGTIIGEKVGAAWGALFGAIVGATNGVSKGALQSGACHMAGASGF